MDRRGRPVPVRTSAPASATPRASIDWSPVPPSLGAESTGSVRPAEPRRLTANLTPKSGRARMLGGDRAL